MRQPICPRRRLRLPNARAALESLESRRLLSTYYVSPSGSDTAAGTSPGAAFKTLQHASDRVVAGDTVDVMAGTYAAGFSLGWTTAATGTAAKPITFQADPSAPAGSVVITGRNANTADGIDLEGVSYVTVSG